MTAMLISGGKAHPITAAQFAAARRYQPIGLVAGVSAAPRAEAPAAPKPDGRAVARAAMLAEIGRKYGEAAKATATATPSRSQGVDPKAATLGQPMPKAASTDGLSLSQRSMLKTIEMHHGKAARSQAEAKFAARVR